MSTTRTRSISAGAGASQSADSAKPSQAYFGKDIRDLTLPEAATLAGLIQRPSYTNPVKWPERAKQRRNVVLK